MVHHRYCSFSFYSNLPQAEASSTVCVQLSAPTNLYSPSWAPVQPTMAHTTGGQLSCVTIHQKYHCSNRQLRSHDQASRDASVEMYRTQLQAYMQLTHSTIVCTADDLVWHLVSCVHMKVEAAAATEHWPACVLQLDSAVSPTHHLMSARLSRTAELHPGR
jgi:hypothetical protein